MAGKKRGRDTETGRRHGRSTRNEQGTGSRPALFFIALVSAGVLVAGGLFWAGWQMRTTEATAPVTAQAFDPGELPYEDGIVIGEWDAPVTVAEFADFQCPACAHVALNFLPDFKERYVEAGQVRLIRFEFPLRHHRQAVPTALAGRCAYEQGLFWDYATTLYDSQGEWARMVDAEAYLIDLFDWLNRGDTGEFEVCLLEKRYEPEVMANQALSVRHPGVTGTPTFFVDGERIPPGDGEALIRKVEEAISAVGSND